jgi:hypothetical protein
MRANGGSHNLDLLSLLTEGSASKILARDVWSQLDAVYKNLTIDNLQYINRVFGEQAFP